MALSINYGNIADYVNQFATQFQTDIVLSARTFDTVSILPGNKYSDVINTMLYSPVTRTGNCLAFSASTSTTLGQRECVVTNFVLDEAICIDELEKKFIGKFAKTGSYNETAPADFTAAWLQSINNEVALDNARQWLIGDTSGRVDASYTKMNGIFSILRFGTGSASVVIGTTASGALVTTASAQNNAKTVVREMITKIPSDILERPDLKLRMNFANYRTLSFVMQDDNNYHFESKIDEGKSWANINWTGQNIEIMADSALANNNAMLLTYEENLWVSYDNLNDPKNYKIWFENKDDSLCLRAKWKLGAQVTWPGYCVIKVS